MKFVTNKFLRDAVIKSVLSEYDIKSQEMSKDEITYGTEVIDPTYDPFQLDKLRDISGLHDKCINVKSEDAVFSGKKLITEEGTELPSDLECLIDDFDFDEELEAFVEDLETFGFAGLELLRDDMGDLKGINRISSLYLRMCRDKERVVQKIDEKENYFKLYNPKDQRRLNRESGLWDTDITTESLSNDIIWFNTKSNESKVYGKPQYLSELDAILTDNAIIEYQQGHFKSNGIPNYIITVTGSIDDDIDDEYTMDDWEADLEKEFKGVTNEPGTALVIAIPSQENGVNVNVTKIGDEKKEGSFLELSNSVSERIYRVHGVPKERLGDASSEGLASNRTTSLLKNYSKSTVSVIQKRISNLVNKTIIRKEFQITNISVNFLPANFEEEDKLLDRGIKLLQNGAMSLGEFINRFGDHYELSMSEDDEYYNCRFMNNQSLDKVIYGDSAATDSEAKLDDVINNLDLGVKGMNYEPNSL